MKTATLVLAAVLGGTCSAQTPSDPSLPLDELSAEVARVSRSLEQVSRALDTLVQLQKTNLLMQRLVIEERRISPQAGELRSAKSNLRNLEEELARMTSFTEETESELDAVAGSGTDQELGLKNQLRQVERELELRTESVEATHRRIQDVLFVRRRRQRQRDVVERTIHVVGVGQRLAIHPQHAVALEVGERRTGRDHVDVLR